MRARDRLGHRDGVDGHVGEVDPGDRALGRSAQVGLGQFLRRHPGQEVGGVDGEVVRQPDLPGDGAGGLLGHGHEDVGRGGVGPALEQAGQQQVPLLPPDQLVVVVRALAPRQQLLGLELDQNGGHQQELRQLVEVDLVPLLGQDPDEPVDDGQERNVEHVDLVGGDQVQQEVDRALEGGCGHRERHTATIPNLPRRAAHPPKAQPTRSGAPWRPTYHGDP